MQTRDDANLSSTCVFEHLFVDNTCTMMSLANEFTDSILPPSFAPTEEDKNEFSALLKEHCSDALFNETIVKFFEAGAKSGEIKDALFNTANLSPISVGSAKSILFSIYRATTRTAIRSYIIFLCLPIIDIFNTAVVAFGKTALYAKAFGAFYLDHIKAQVDKLMGSTAESLLQPLIARGFCLLSFICQHDTLPEHAPAKLSKLHIEVPVEGLTSFEELFNRIAAKHEEINAKPATGVNLDNSFNNAVHIYSFIAPQWDNLSAALNLRTEAPKKPVGNSFSGGSSPLPDSDVVSIFSGNYSRVPADYPLAASIDANIISNFKNFNQLSASQKLRTARYLSDNRERFNLIIGNATAIITNTLNDRLNGHFSDLCARCDSSKYRAVNARTMTGGSNNTFAANSKLFLNKLKKAFNEANINTFSDATNFINHQYIPMLTQFVSKANLEFGSAETSSVLSKYATSSSLNLIGAANNLHSPVTQVTKFVEKPVVKYVDRVIEKPVFAGGAKDDKPSKKSATETYISALGAGLAEFNTQFTSIYKQLTKSINSIGALPDISAQQSLDILSLCESLANIGIADAKTSAKISGFNQAKNLQPLYLKYLEATLVQISRIQIPVFGQITVQLNNLKKLLVDTAAKIEVIRSRYVNSPRAISEQIIISNHELDAPCGLNNDDINAMATAIRRLRNLAETSVNLTSRQKDVELAMTNYDNTMEQRRKAINEHYEYILIGIKAKYNRDINFTAETKFRLDQEIALKEQMRDCMLYLNDVLDPALARQRNEIAKHVNLTDEQLVNVEKAFNHYRENQSETQFRKALAKLNHAMQTKHIGGIYKIIKKIKKVILASKFIDFIEQLCKELGLFTSGFDWGKFAERVSMIVALASIDLESVIYTQTHKFDGTENEVDEGWSRLNMIDLVTKFINEKLFINPQRENEVKYIGILSGMVQDISSSSRLAFNGENVDAVGMKKALMRLVDKNPDEGDHGMFTADANLGAKWVKNLSKDNQICISTNIINPEFKLALASIESLYAYVITIFDKYFALRYEGKLELPMNIGRLMGGALNEEKKILGAGVFDHPITSVHLTAAVIPDAVPFYLVAINTVAWYIKKFVNERPDAATVTRRMVVNKASILKPFVDIFGEEGNEKATIESLTIDQLKRLVVPLNEIWGRTQGTPAARLSHAIDILFGECNSCIIFTDETHLEMIKATQDLSKATLDAIGDNMSIIVDQINNALTENAPAANESEQNKAFERRMHDAFVAIKDKPAEQSFAILKQQLCPAKDATCNELHEYFKFMELVITPLLHSAKTYSNLFALFNSYKLTFTQDATTINFDEVNAGGIPIIFDRKDNKSTAWQLIEAIRNGASEHKALFIASPIVLSYNKLLLREALQKCHANGSFTMPEFWIALDEKTYPTRKTYTFKIDAEKNINDNLVLMKQIWGHVHANTVADYYRQCVNEYKADFEHFINNFLSYPGLSDYTIAKIRQKANEVIKNDIKKDEALETALTNIPVKKCDDYVAPPPPAFVAFLPQMNGTDFVEEIYVTKDSETVEYDNVDIRDPVPLFRPNVNIEGTSMYIKSRSAKKQHITACEYGWLDWVLYTLARCDRTNFCLPFRFIQILQNRAIYTPFIAAPSVNRKLNLMNYNRTTTGAYSNILTQNIIARSVSDRNKAYIDYYQMNPRWIGSLVGIIPYVLSTLQAYRDSMNQTVQHQRENIYELLTYLIEDVRKLYNEISNYAPYCEFMCDSVDAVPAEPATDINQMNANTFAQLVKFVDEFDLNASDISDIIKIEWANMYAFAGLPKMTFPVHSKQDRFAFIKAFAPEKINNGGTASMFDTTVQTLARLTWSNLIAKSANHIAKFKNVWRELDETIIETIHIMCEVNPMIVQKFINNIVDYFKATVGIDSMNMRGGAMTVTETGIETYNEDTIQKLTRGIIGVREREVRSQNKDTVHTRLEARTKLEELIARKTIDGDVRFDVVWRSLAKDTKKLAGGHGTDYTTAEADTTPLIAKINEKIVDVFEKTHAMLTSNEMYAKWVEAADKLTIGQKTFIALLESTLIVLNAILAAVKNANPKKDQVAAAEPDAAAVADAITVGIVLADAELAIAGEEASDLKRMLVKIKPIIESIRAILNPVANGDNSRIDITKLTERVMVDTIYAIYNNLNGSIIDIIKYSANEGLVIEAEDVLNAMFKSDANALKHVYVAGFAGGVTNVDLIGQDTHELIKIIAMSIASNPVNRIIYHNVNTKKIAREFVLKDANTNATEEELKALAKLWVALKPEYHATHNKSNISNEIYGMLTRADKLITPIAMRGVDGALVDDTDYTKTLFEDARPDALQADIKARFKKYVDEIIAICKSQDGENGEAKQTKAINAVKAEGFSEESIIIKYIANKICHDNSEAITIGAADIKDTTDAYIADQSDANFDAICDVGNFKALNYTDDNAGINDLFKNIGKTMYAVKDIVKVLLITEAATEMTVKAANGAPAAVTTFSINNRFTNTVFNTQIKDINVHPMIMQTVPSDHPNILSRYLCSPRYDIYNASFVNGVSDIYNAPVLNIEHICTGVNRTTAFRPISITRAISASAATTVIVTNANAPASLKDGNIDFGRANPTEALVVPTSMQTFIENGVFGPVKEIDTSAIKAKNDNIGFITKLCGGVGSIDGFVQKYIETGNPMIGTTYDQVLHSAYGCIEHNAPGDNIFTSIFRHGSLVNGGIKEYGENGYDSSKLMTAALKYFKKTAIQSASMFNNMTFPSILYGAGMLRKICTDLSDVVANVAANAGGMSEQMKTYIYMLRNFDISPVDGRNHTNPLYVHVRNHLGQSPASDIEAKQKSSFRELVEGDHAVVRATYNSPLIDRTKAPSLCAQMMYTFVDMAERTDSPENRKKLGPMFANDVHELMKISASPVGALIRECDVLSTYAFAVHEVLLKTSYWSHEVNRYQTYANVSPREPFNFSIE